jgi:cyclase
MEKISNNVYVELGTRGSNNSFVVTGEGLVMIDTPMFPSDAKKWREAMAPFGPVRYVLDTEPHGDHTSGNGYFEGTVIAHEGTRQAVLASDIQQLKQMLAQMGPQPEAIPADFKFKAPAITFTSKLTFYLGEHTFQLINLPGHSAFQSPVFVPEEGVLFTSDNVVNGTPPFMHQALPYEWIESLKQMQKLGAKKLVPGHGTVCGPEYLADMIDTIQGAVDAVTAALKKGMSLEVAQKEITLFPRFPKNERTIQMQNMGLTRLYEVLGKKK